MLGKVGEWSAPEKREQKVALAPEAPNLIPTRGPTTDGDSIACSWIASTQAGGGRTDETRHRVVGARWSDVSGAASCCVHRVPGCRSRGNLHGCLVSWCCPAESMSSWRRPRQRRRVEKGSVMHQTSRLSRAALTGPVLALLAISGCVSPVDQSHEGGSSKLCDGSFDNELARFRCLLDNWTDASNRGDGRALQHVQREVDRRYVVDRSILILDLGGFSKISRSAGILGAMALVQEVWKALSPIIVHHNGEIVKDEADTLYALLPDMVSAVSASISMEAELMALLQRIRAQRGASAPAFSALSIGIGYGKVIRIGKGRDVEDAYGSEVNYAYGAGEETAKHGEILITQAAKTRLYSETSGKPLPGVRAITERPQQGYSLWAVER